MQGRGTKGGYSILLIVNYIMEERLIRNWKDTKYTRLIRISEENHQFLKKTKKGRKSLAGLLDDIISNYKKNGK
jgi:hypothetical protein